MGFSVLFSNPISESVQYFGIIATFLLSIYTLRKDTRKERIENRTAIVDRHLQIWSLTYDRPSLNRVHKRVADLKTRPVSHEERRFVISLVIHLDDVHRTQKARLLDKFDGLELDVGELFTRPVVRAVWEEIKHLYNPEFVHFVESCISRFSEKLT